MRVSSNCVKRSVPPSLTGAHGLTAHQLARFDDLATALVIDPFLNFVTHKMEATLRKPPPSAVWMSLQRDLKLFREGYLDYPACRDRLLATARSAGLATESELASPGFQRHLCRHLRLLDANSGVYIAECRRYAHEGHRGARVLASRAYERHEKLEGLLGCMAELSPTEELTFLQPGVNDFSVMYSMRKGLSQLWLGPAAYINHDCRPNAQFVMNGDGTASLRTVKPIRPDEEVLIRYGGDFFGLGNCECECATCERRCEGAFSRASTVVSTASSSSYRLRDTDKRLDRLRSLQTVASSTDSSSESFSSSCTRINGTNESVKLPQELPQEDDLPPPSLRLASPSNVAVVSTTTASSSLSASNGKRRRHKGDLPSSSRHDNYLLMPRLRRKRRASQRFEALRLASIETPCCDIQAAGSSSEPMRSSFSSSSPSSSSSSSSSSSICVANTSKVEVVPKLVIRISQDGAVTIRRRDHSTPDTLMSDTDCCNPSSSNRLAVPLLLSSRNDSTAL